MANNEYFEVFVNGTWCKVVFAGPAVDYSLNMKWQCLQMEYGFENVRLVKEA